MDKKSTILFSAFSLMILGSMYLAYSEYILSNKIIYFTDADSVPSTFGIVKDFLRI